MSERLRECSGIVSAIFPICIYINKYIDRGHISYYNVQKLNDKICLERGQQVSAASLDTGGLFLVYHS